MLQYTGIGKGIIIGIPAQKIMGLAMELHEMKLLHSFKTMKKAHTVGEQLC